MADLQTSSAARGGKPRARKHAFHLDMTPMVDLAFLLLTFFMLTTTFAKPTVMELVMPVKDAASQNSVSERKALTLILGENSQVHYFFGLNAAGSRPNVHTTNLGPAGLRRQRQQPAPVVLIKTGPGAKYHDLVDALDEMTITGQAKYALTDLNQADKDLLSSLY